jgi:cellulose biosynthesis protein BcsQ
MDWDGLCMLKDSRLLAKPPQELLEQCPHGKIATFATNVKLLMTHGVQIKDKLDIVSIDHHPTFVDLCDSSNEDETILISIQPSNFSLLNSTTFDDSFQSD